MPKVKMSIKRYESLGESYSGICLACGAIKDSGVEPDATGYPCDACDAHQVCGIEHALITGQLDIGDDEDEDEDFDEDEDDDEFDDLDDDEFDEDDFDEDDDDDLVAVSNRRIECFA
jgi:hypothetical protein